MNQNLKQLEAKLNIRFHNPHLLRQAFTHSSFVNENRSNKVGDNERLEFLGDAVLELTVSEYLFHQNKDQTEGELTKQRAAIVCEPSLMKFAEALGFGKYVLLGKGEESTGGRIRAALLADVFESFIGALFIDQGLEAVKQFLHTHVFSDDSVKGKLPFEDFKTRLQELIQQQNHGVIDYRIVEEIGPAHDRMFVSEVFNGEVMLGRGKGRSKKEAEQQAASSALIKLDS